MGSLKYLHQGKVNTVDFVKQSESPLKILDGGVVKGIPLGDTGPIKLLVGGKVKAIGAGAPADVLIIYGANNYYYTKDLSHIKDINLGIYTNGFVWGGECINGYFYDCRRINSIWLVRKKSWTTGKTVKEVEGTQSPGSEWDSAEGVSDKYIYQLWWKKDMVWNEEKEIYEFKGTFIDASKWDTNLSLISRVSTYWNVDTEETELWSGLALRCSKDEDGIFCIAGSFDGGYKIFIVDTISFDSTYFTKTYDNASVIVDRYEKEILEYDNSGNFRAYDYSGSFKRTFSITKEPANTYFALSPEHYYFFMTQPYELWQTDKEGVLIKKISINEYRDAVKWRHQLEENVS